MPNVKEIISLMDSPSKERIALIEKAYNFAQEAHKDHKRYSNEPFFNHLYETAKGLAELGMGSKTIAAGFLHDSIEDVGVTSETIEKEFGSDVLFLVEGVTKLGTLKYRGLERHAESLRKLFVATSQDIRVVIIKLVDRLHNMKTLGYVPKGKQKRIALETLEVYSPIAERLGMGLLKRELDDLAFPYVYPKEHKQTAQLLKQRSKENERHLNKVEKSLKKELAGGGITNFRTERRIKSIYSLYRKLLRKENDIEKIHDISALRIIVPTISDCYKVLGVIHGLWKPLPGKIKDYIAFPKPNGYQSIHTTIYTGDGGILEIQIRTEVMHKEAQYGIASHLSYKEMLGDSAKKKKKNSTLWISQFFSKKEGEIKSKSSSDESVPNWIKEIADSQNDTSLNEEFLDNLKSDFFSHRVFVFTPEHDVVDLPVDSSPVDFAYIIHSDIGDHISGALVNGKMVSLDTKLKNGDTIEIQTKKSSKPTQKWLEFAKTTTAKRHIRSALQKEESK